MSAYARLPSSVGTGCAQLQRVATVRSNAGEVQDGSSSDSGGAATSVKEEGVWGGCGWSEGGGDVSACSSRAVPGDVVTLSATLGDGWDDLAEGALFASPKDASSGSSAAGRIDVLRTTTNGPPFAAGGGRAGGGGPQTGWEVLLQQEVLLLPRSHTRVVPLKDSGVMVGLLVMNPRPAAHPPRVDGAGGDGDGEGPTPTVAAAASAARASLRLAVPVLSKACAMELRRSLVAAGGLLLISGLLVAVEWCHPAVTCGC